MPAFNGRLMPLEIAGVPVPVLVLGMVAFGAAMFAVLVPPPALKLLLALLAVACFAAFVLGLRERSDLPFWRLKYLRGRPRGTVEAPHG